jgi:type IV pilus assembly protein PilC
MVRGAMIYPIIIGVMAVVTTVFMLTFVLPQFTSLFAGKDALLPKPTVVLMSISVIMRTYWHMLIGGLVVGIVAFQRIIRTTIGRQYWDTFKLRVPVFKRMFRALYITRSMQTMGELVNAGVPMLEALRITSEISGNYVYRRLWLQVQNAVREGGRIAEQLVGQPLLPKNVVQMISAGEESGKLGTVLEDVSAYYAKELNSTIKAVTSMIEPLMIIIMGVVVGFIAMSVVLPIFKLSSLVK